VLEIVAPLREYELTFLEGRIIHADRLDIPLCDYLFEQLTDADKKQVNQERLRDSNKGDLLTRIIESTKLSIRELIAYKHEYDRDTLRLLAAERSISFDFRTKIIRCPEGLSLELSPGHYLLDLLEAAESGTAPTAAKPAPQHQAQAPAPAPKADAPAPTVLPIAASASPEPEPANPSKGKSPTRIRARRKPKRPPRVGRWNKHDEIAPPQAKKRKREKLAVSGNQMFLGVKLLLFLSLVVFAPPFLNDWVSTLIAFSFPQ